MTEMMPESDSYTQEAQQNKKQVMALFNALFPGLPVPYEHVFDLLKYLSETHVNPHILPRIIRGVHNIYIGTGKGQVIVHVAKDMMNVSIRETDEDMKVTE